MTSGIPGPAATTQSLAKEFSHGSDSASEMARGQVKEATGKLVGDEKLEDEGETQQYLADAEEKEALKPWRREHQQP